MDVSRLHWGVRNLPEWTFSLPAAEPLSQAAEPLRGFRAPPWPLKRQKARLIDFKWVDFCWLQQGVCTHLDVFKIKEKLKCSMTRDSHSPCQLIQLNVDHLIPLRAPEHIQSHGTKASHTLLHHYSIFRHVFNKKEFRLAYELNQDPRPDHIRSSPFSVSFQLKFRHHPLPLPPGRPLWQ